MIFYEINGVKSRICTSEVAVSEFDIVRYGWVTLDRVQFLNCQNDSINVLYNIPSSLITCLFPYRSRDPSQRGRPAGHVRRAPRHGTR